MLWGAAAALVIMVNGARLFNTYFIQAFAPLAVLAAWLIVDRARASLSGRVVACRNGTLDGPADGPAALSDAGARVGAG